MSKCANHALDNTRHFPKMRVMRFPHFPRTWLCTFFALIFWSSGNGATFRDSLTNSTAIANNFIYWSLSPLGENPEAGGCSFEPNPLFGVELMTPVGDTMQAAWAFNRPLPVSRDWTVTLRVHISDFTNAQNYPYYGVGISILRYLAEPPAGVPTERVNIGMSRESINSISGQDLLNYISGGLFTGGFEQSLVRSSVGGAQEAFVRASFTASTKKIALFFSTNGISFVPLSDLVFDLGQQWELGEGDELTVAVTASSIPSSWEAGSIDYAVTSGQIYARDFEVAFSDAPEGRFVLRLESTTDLSAAWEQVPLSFDRLNTDGNIVLGEPGASAGFYRLHLSPEP